MIMFLVSPRPLEQTAPCNSRRTSEVGSLFSRLFDMLQGGVRFFESVGIVVMPPSIGSCACFSRHVSFYHAVGTPVSLLLFFGLRVEDSSLIFLKRRFSALCPFPLAHDGLLRRCPVLTLRDDPSGQRE